MAATLRARPERVDIRSKQRNAAVLRARAMLRSLVAMKKDLSWITVGGGRLAVGGRPKLTAFAAMAREGCTHILTLLSEREGASSLQGAAILAGLTWLWLPLANGTPPPEGRDDDVRRALADVHAALAAGGSVYVHCAAGIHRTGMIANAVLRAAGVSREDALTALRAMRPLTGEGVGDVRIAWGDRFAHRGGPPLA